MAQDFLRLGPNYYFFFLFLTSQEDPFEYFSETFQGIFPSSRSALYNNIMMLKVRNTLSPRNPTYCSVLIPVVKHMGTQRRKRVVHGAFLVCKYALPVPSLPFPSYAEMGYNFPSSFHSPRVPTHADSHPKKSPWNHPICSSFTGCSCILAINGGRRRGLLGDLLSLSP